jgi:DNA-binding LacI/PurR family transcriptional regulator
MEDVARAARVNRTTVSRALKNDPRLTAATIAAVQQVAAQIGYRSNPLVAALMAQRAGRRSGVELGTIAYITSELERHQHPVLREFQAGARQRAEQTGYRLEAFELTANGMTGARLSAVLQARGIRGILIAPRAEPRARLNLDWGQFASAALGYSLLRPMLHRAASHSFHGALLALRELRKLGYRRIGFCMDSGVSQRVDENWLAGFLVYQSHHPRDKLSLLIEAGFNAESFHRWCKQERPEVIVTDNHAFEFHGLKKCGLRVPEEVGFVSLAWSEESPHQSGINQNSPSVAAAAVDMIIGQLQRNETGVPLHPKTTLIEGTWVPGSTAPGPAGSSKGKTGLEAPVS